MNEPQSDSVIQDMSSRARAKGHILALPPFKGQLDEPRQVEFPVSPFPHLQVGDNDIMYFRIIVRIKIIRTHAYNTQNRPGT